MAKVKNITGDTLSLFNASAPPIHGANCKEPLCGPACNEITLRDENFVDRAWPKSTWDLVEAPELDGYEDQSDDEAWLYAEPLPEPEEVEPVQEQAFDPSQYLVEQVVAYLATADENERARVIAAEASDKARKGIIEWSE